MRNSPFLLIMFFCGCATRHLDTIAINVGQISPSYDLRFSYEVKNAFSSEYFGMVGFVLENNTNQWMTVDSVEIIADDVQKSNIAITGGNDIDVWYTSMSKEKQIESYNRRLLWGSISFVATLGNTLSKDEQTKRAAKFAAISTGSMVTLERFTNIKNQIELSEYFPDDHLMRTPFRIPPGLGVDKWMVINSQVHSKDIVCPMLKLKMYMNGNTTKEYNLEFIKNYDVELSQEYLPSTSYSGVWQSKLVKSTFKALNKKK